MKLMKFIIAILLIYCLLGTTYLLFFTKADARQIEPEIKYIEKIIYEKPHYELFEVTAYTAGYESTGKNPQDEGYRVTASGEPVLEGRTMACPPSIEFGTPIYVPQFENVFFCTDRGSSITEGKLDIFMEDVDRALEFGRRKIEAVVLPKI